MVKFYEAHKRQWNEKTLKRIKYGSAKWCPNCIVTAVFLSESDFSKPRMKTKISTQAQFQHFKLFYVGQINSIRFKFMKSYVTFASAVPYVRFTTETR